MNRGLLFTILSVTMASNVGAQGRTHVLIVTGLSAEPQFAVQFADEGGRVFDAAHGPWHVADSDLVYLAENPAADHRVTAKATRESVAAAFNGLAARTHPGDLLFVMLIGHGAGEMETSALNIPGPDPTVVDYAAWLIPFRGIDVVFVNGSSASGDFAHFLAGPQRVIITATKTAFERNETEFAKYFTRALTGSAADADKNGTVTVDEAFRYAAAEVAKSYGADGRMLTEHAVMTDSAGLAPRLAFGGSAAAGDSRVVALIGERRLLEAQVDSLRRAKPGIDSAMYAGALERLLIAIAEKTRAINTLQAAKP